MPEETTLASPGLGCPGGSSALPVHWQAAVSAETHVGFRKAEL